MTRMNCIETDCVDEEEYQTQFLPHATKPAESNMWAYHNYEHDNFQHFYTPASDTKFVPDPSGHDAFTYRDTAFAVLPPQFSYPLQPNFPQHLAASQYFPRHHVNTRPFMPFYGTSEPQMMISRGLDYTMTRSIPHGMDFDMPTPTYSPASMSPTTSSPSLSFMSSPEQCYPYTAWFPKIPCSPQHEEVRMADELNEDDGPFDKPYAQLIYDALMQAPGHRMFLRDIYEWFIENTKKPRESGTNGWQNSIRHNLSMNQAFENDKNDPAAGRGARKANSVWILTEHAIKNGVQSTTRYRKNHSSKKGAVNKTPALKRQRSGARGGRATRRAARLRRTEDDPRKGYTSQSQPTTNIPLSPIDSRMHPSRDQWMNYDAYSPNTPQADHFNQTYNLPQNLHYQVGETDIKYEAEPFMDGINELHRAPSQGGSSDYFDDVTRFR